MARTKQTVRDKWEEKKRKPSEGSSADAAAEPEGSAGVLLPEGFAVKSEKDGLKDAGEESEEVEEEGEEDEFVVKCILSEKMHRGKLSYKVLWENEDEEITWEPSEHLENTVALEEWLQKKKDGVAATAAEEEEEVEEEEKDDDDDSEDESDEAPRSSRRKKRKMDDDDYVDSEDESADEDSEDDEDEYVPEGRGGRRGGRRGGGGGGRSSKRSKPAPKLNDRQKRLLDEDLESGSNARLVEALRSLVNGHPELYAEVRTLLQGQEPAARTSKPKKRIDDEEDEDEDEDDEDDDDEVDPALATVASSDDDE